MNEIILKNVTKRYGDLVAVSDFNMQIKEKEKIAIMGPSGCGKTTILRLLCGLETADSGKITGVPDKISYLFQENRLCEDFSPVSNVRFLTGKTVKERIIIKTLNDFGLTENLDKPVKTMSGGMKRRVAIIRAILTNCDLLVLDEPFKGLDEALKVSVMKKVKEMIEDKTVIMVTHDSEEATFLCEKVINIV